MRAPRDWSRRSPDSTPTYRRIDPMPRGHSILPGSHPSAGPVGRCVVRFATSSARLNVDVVIAPDKFAGTLSAPEAAAAIASGWRESAPGSRLIELPLSDGGPGLLDVVEYASGGERVPVATIDPLGRPVSADVLVTDAE